MAFSASQFKNFIRTIVVAAVAKEFRNAKIIEAALSKAQADGKVATGGLIRPDLTGSILPTKDDRWLIKPDAVIVEVGSVSDGLPENINVNLRVEFGVDNEYYFTRSDVDGDYEGSFPEVEQIRRWIIAKQGRGMQFTYKDKPADLSNPTHLTSIAFLIGRKIMREGFDRHRRSDYFEDVGDKVDAVLRRGLERASSRVLEKYEEELYNAIVEAIDINIV